MQIFPSHDALSERYRKTLYYGRLPETDRPSLPFTQLAVEQFTSCGLDALGEKLGRLDAARAGDITRNACAGPNSLVLALLLASVPELVDNLGDSFDSSILFTILTSSIRQLSKADGVIP